MNNLIILARRDETLKAFCNRPYFKNAGVRFRNVGGNPGYTLFMDDRTVLPAVLRFLD